MTHRLTYVVHRESDDTITVEVRTGINHGNLSVGFVEIELTAVGARVHGTNGKDDSDAPGQIVLHAEAPA